MELNETYKLSHSKGHHKIRQPMVWEKIFANDATYKDLVSKTYTQVIQLNSQKT